MVGIFSSTIDWWCLYIITYCLAYLDASMVGDLLVSVRRKKAEEEARASESIHTDVLQMRLVSQGSRLSSRR